MAIAPQATAIAPTAPKMMIASTLPPVPITPPVTILVVMAITFPPIPLRRSLAGMMAQAATMRINKRKRLASWKSV